MKSVVLISVIYLTVMIDSGTSLKCYHCGVDIRDSVAEKQICGDPFFKNDSLLIDCVPLAIGCAKVDFGIPGIPDKIFAIARSCVTYAELKKFNEMQPKVGSLAFCETDGCNGSQSLTSSTVVMMILIVIAKCLFHWSY